MTTPDDQARGLSYGDDREGAALGRENGGLRDGSGDGLLGDRGGDRGADRDRDLADGSDRRDDRDRLDGDQLDARRDRLDGDRRDGGRRDSDAPDRNSDVPYDAEHNPDVISLDEQADAAGTGRESGRSDRREERTGVGFTAGTDARGRDGAGYRDDAARGGLTDDRSRSDLDRDATGFDGARGDRVAEGDRTGVDARGRSADGDRVHVHGDIDEDFAPDENHAPHDEGGLGGQNRL